MRMVVVEVVTRVRVRVRVLFTRGGYETCAVLKKRGCQAGDASRNDMTATRINSYIKRV